MNENRQAFNERLVQVFRQETKGRLDRMRLQLSTIESIGSQAATAELVSLQLEIHSLKGAARSVERPDLEILCQDAETLLINTRERGICLSAEMLQSLHDLIDYLDRVVIQSSAETVDFGSNSLRLKLNSLAKKSSRSSTF
jgi:two-component system chemotaxis sensor kinase CheA